MKRANGNGDGADHTLFVPFLIASMNMPPNKSLSECGRGPQLPGGCLGRRIAQFYVAVRALLNINVIMPFWSLQAKKPFAALFDDDATIFGSTGVKTGRHCQVL